MSLSLVALGDHALSLKEEKDSKHVHVLHENLRGGIRFHGSEVVDIFSRNSLFTGKHWRAKILEHGSCPFPNLHNMVRLRFEAENESVITTLD